MTTASVGANCGTGSPADLPDEVAPPLPEWIQALELSFLLGRRKHDEAMAQIEMTTCPQIAMRLAETCACHGFPDGIIALARRGLAIPQHPYETVLWQTVSGAWPEVLFEWMGSAPFVAGFFATAMRLDERQPPWDVPAERDDLPPQLEALALCGVSAAAVFSNVRAILARRPPRDAIDRALLCAAAGPCAQLDQVSDILQDSGMTRRRSQWRAVCDECLAMPPEADVARTCAMLLDAGADAAQIKSLALVPAVIRGFPSVFDLLVQRGAKPADRALELAALGYRHNAEFVPDFLRAAEIHLREIARDVLDDLTSPDDAGGSVSFLISFDALATLLDEGHLSGRALDRALAACFGTCRNTDFAGQAAILLARGADPSFLRDERDLRRLIDVLPKAHPFRPEAARRLMRARLGG